MISEFSWKMNPVVPHMHQFPHRTYINTKYTQGGIPMPGGWEYQPYITTYDSFIFYNAIGTHDDYFYHPIAVAKQIVNGTNYRFMTIAEPKETGLTPHFAIVEIYQPLNGKAYATSITPL